MSGSPVRAGERALVGGDLALRGRAWGGPLFCVAMLGCALPPPPGNPAELFAPPDGRPLGGPLVVTAERATLDAAELSVWTWPELEAVAVDAGSGAAGSSASYVTLTPVEPFGARWYVLRWRPGDDPAAPRAAGAVPLSDGTVVWRFYGLMLPEVDQIFLGEPTEMYVELSMPVVLSAGRSLGDVVTVGDGSANCQPYFAPGVPILGEPLVPIRCDTAPDWASGVRVQLSGVESRGGVPLVALDLVVRFAPGAETSLVPPRAVVPPPVPAALCAGRACEP